MQLLNWSQSRPLLVTGATIISLSLVLVLAVTNDVGSKSEGRSSRLRPRYAFDGVRVRGQTFHQHQGEPVDLKIRGEVQRRVREAESGFRPHLVAKREITTDVPNASPPFYKAYSGSSNQGLPTGCQKCTIVGNTGSLTGASLGWVADHSDCVFRLGVAPTEGYERDVGTKTTVRVLPGESMIDLLRHPERLTTGPLRAQTWLVFDAQKVDALKLRPKLREQAKKASVTVLAVTSAGETDSKSTFKVEADRIGYKQLGSKPSTLWYAIHATIQAGCNNTHIFGVPGPKFCKKHANTHHGQTPSRYWGVSSPPTCSRGKDWGSGPPVSEDLIMTLADRRAAQGWGFERPGQVIFMAPAWSLPEL